MNSKAEGLCLCTNRDTQVLFPEKVKFWEFRELMQSVWPTPIKLLGQTKLSFSCVKFGSHSVGFHSRIIEKNWSWHSWLPFATCHFMQSSTEAAALDEVPCIDLFLVKCGIMIFHFFFSFFYQLDCVMCSHQKRPCEHSNFSRQLINLYCLKKSSQVEGTKSDYDILCVFAPLCARVCVCV